VTQPPLDDAPKPKSLLQYLGIGLGAGALAIVVLVAVMVVLVPAATGSRALTVLTGSMTPAYPAGTLVIVKPTPPDEVTIGDVMTYQLRSGEPTLVTHRVIEKIYDTNGELSFTTKGDHNDLPDDEPVKAVQVVGTVWYGVPYLGWVNNAVNGELRPLIIPIVVGLLFAYAVWMIISGARDRLKKKRASA
jgi:signal peptidase